ncbi:MAG: UDP-glucose:undecaprenyl-phosphate glucose-1-phosphate transferase [Myxococcota bacterium]|nr:UDP-glucose:undecaprenyl-phosphate glucose-1-phosphate transferase [Myxococcota bacterium]
MLKKHAQVFQTLLVISDVVVWVFAFALAHLVRFWSPGFIEFSSRPPRKDTILVLALAVGGFFLSYLLIGLYRSHRISGPASEVLELLKGAGLGLLILVGLGYFVLDVRYSRLTLVIFSAFVFMLNLVSRSTLRSILHLMRARGWNQRSVVVVGVGELAREIAEAIDRHPEFGLRLLGFVSTRPVRRGRFSGRPILGDAGSLARILEETQADQVLFALPNGEEHRLRELLDSMSGVVADVRMAPDLTRFMTLNSSVEELGDLPLINLQVSPMSGWNAVLKRGFDLVFGGLALLVASPVMAVCAVLVRMGGPGPIFYRQERVGLDGRPFQILKFRTMPVDAEANGPVFQSQGAANRATRTGAFMRKYSLDELPQLFNVLRGEMSLVGPRPERPVFIRQFQQRIPQYHLRHKVKAGITGWAQIHGWRGDTSIERRVECDLYYIENWSLGLDFRILARTIFGGFLSRNAY